MPDGVLHAGPVVESKTGRDSAFLEYTDLTEARMKQYIPIRSTIL